MTEAAIREKRKTVTRRLGWLFLEPGDLIQPVRKTMGLGKGGRVEKIGGPICILRVNREALSDMTGEYGFLETEREGFPEGHPRHWPSSFIEHFCLVNRCVPNTEITRILFAYV